MVHEREQKPISTSSYSILVEESTVESRNNSGDSFGIDDKNVQEQTVQVCACTVVALT